MITESDCKKLKSCFNTPQHKALGNQFALHMERFGVVVSEEVLLCGMMIFTSITENKSPSLKG